MCGISACLGNVKIIQQLILSLKMLQNRGYDSAGLTFIDNNKLKTYKYASDSISGIKKIENFIDKNEFTHIGIAHTRWATHGSKTDNNAHPHLDHLGNIALVHNGIIENYQELKNFLVKQNINFKSETDTEVIVNLISYYKTKYSNMKKAIQTTINQLQGTWGLVIMDLEEPNKLYATRFGSPLLLGKTEKSIMITSEISGFCNYINDFFVLKEKDILIVEMNENDIEIRTQKLNYKYQNLNNSSFETSPGEFEYWTIKEINEQTESIKRVINYGARIENEYKVKLGGLFSHKDQLSFIENLIILGCGTSLNAGFIGQSFFEEYDLFNNVIVIDGAEFNKKMIPRKGKTALLLLSQSGETKDLHRCIKIGRENDTMILSIVNVVDSMIAREADCGVYLNAGREVGVASTKSFTSQLVVLKMISIWFAQNLNVHQMLRKESINDIRLLSNEVCNLIKNVEHKTKIIAQNILNTGHKSLFILGKGKNQHIANEASLKIKELSYLHAEGYSGSALKHGPFALLEKDTPVIFILSDDETLPKMKNAIEEVKSRNALVIIISEVELPENINFIKINKNKHMGSVLIIIVFQLIAYYLAILQDINPDFPRNLAKVVTVE